MRRVGTAGPYICRIKHRDMPKINHQPTQSGTETKPKRLNNRKPLNLLTAMEQIVEASSDSNLSADFFRQAKRPIAYVADKLSLTPMQSVLLSVFMDRSDDTRIQMGELASYFGCRKIRMLQHAKDVDALEQRGYVRCCRDERSTTYRVPQQVIEALRQDKPYEPEPYTAMSCSELFGCLEDLFEQRRDDELTYAALLDEVERLFAANTHLEFVRKMDYYRPSLLEEDWEWMMLLFLCHLFVNNDDDNVGSHDFESLYDRKYIFRHVKSFMEEGETTLFELKLVEFVNNDGFADRSAYKLTDNAKAELLSELNINACKKSTKGLLRHTALTAKQLCYNPREGREVERLASLLEPSRFDAVLRRMEASGMRRGFTCLFYGAPGTGKTETVYQLARQSGRDIMEVNVEAVKSMWVGESEKNIKALFDRYRSHVASSQVAPILLFNEADAIIGKRLEGAERAVDRMENSIQNIILQEMERLEGIMIATTNLTQNMDKAFERRFLYKIEFERPTIEAKRAIWQSMMPDLDTKAVGELAAAYDFSGGQIENIARKRAVQSIISGDEEVGMEELRRFCESEAIAQPGRRRRIGF